MVLGGGTAPPGSLLDVDPLMEDYVSYRGTSLIRNCLPLGPYSRAMPRALWWFLGGGAFLMSEVPLYWRTMSSTAVERFWKE